MKVEFGITQAETVFGVLQGESCDRCIEGSRDDQSVGVEAWSSSDTDSSVEETIA